MFRGIRLSYHFNPRAPRGARHKESRNASLRVEFQSTRPARGATEIECKRNKRSLFQSTRPARGATVLMLGLILILIPISIHAPREGRDSWTVVRLKEIRDFNPRAPRGARPEGRLQKTKPTSISIHAPREGRDVATFPKSVYGSISIHAPREGRDVLLVGLGVYKFVFQSTRPARGATRRWIPGRS